MASSDDIAKVLVRLGLSLVILWFAVNQLFRPDYFIGYLPEFLFSSPNAALFVQANGVFEVVFGLMLLLGVLTRFVAAVLALHLLGIMLSLGYNENAIRDFGLMIALMSVAVAGEDIWSIKHLRKLIR